MRIHWVSLLTFVPLPSVAASSPPTTPNPGTALNTTNYEPECGLEKPTAKGWKKNRKAIRNWFSGVFKDFRHDDEHKSVAVYMRDNFASKAAPSSMDCEMVGSCTIGSCLALDDDLSQEEKQMAYYVFEQISGIIHLHQCIDKSTIDGGTYMYRRASELVDRFTSAPRIEHAIKEKIRREKIGMAAGSAIALMASGGLAFGESASTKLMAHSFGLVSGAYIGIVGIINAARREDNEIIADVEEGIQSSFNELLHNSSDSIAADLRHLMEGRRNGRNKNIKSTIGKGNFLSPDIDLCYQLKEHMEAFLFAVIINALWGFDRAYILDVDAPGSDCLSDTRGHANYRVCLPESPDRSYWLYAIDQSKEGDTFKSKQAQVIGPTGFHAFDNETVAEYGILREDIVRSSLFVHRNKLEDYITNLDVEYIGNVYTDEQYRGSNLGKVPGAFSVPVCRNPGGESISSVWKDAARNYPCMCGEFGWNDGTWAYYKDETKDFINKTGFKYSEDWEDFCSNHNDCRGENSIDWHSEFDADRSEGDPKIPPKLKHPFKKCEKPNEHTTPGNPDKDK